MNAILLRPNLYDINSILGLNKGGAKGLIGTIFFFFFKWGKVGGDKCHRVKSSLYLFILLLHFRIMLLLLYLSNRNVLMMKYF